MKARIALAIMSVAGILSPVLQAQAPPSNITAVDHPWDNGTRIDLTWSLSPDDSALQGYIIRKKAADDAEFARVDMVPPGTTEFTVSDLNLATPYLFEVTALSAGNTESTPAV